MTKPITIGKFSGMNNIKTDEGEINEPRVILNADVTSQGRIKKRSGQTKDFTMTEPHSLWANEDVMLCVSNGTLYSLSGTTSTSLSSVTGPKHPLYYAEVDGLVYMSNPYWQGVYNHATASVSTWGITLPSSPILSATTGSLPSGMYFVCLTTVSGSDISGNSPVSVIELPDDGSGISISNLGASDIVWCTDPGGSVFHPVGAVSVITQVPETPEPLPSLFCSPPPYMENITYVFGRMWGSVGSRLYYSEPYRVSLYNKNTSFFDFETNIGIIARVPTGIFVGCEDKTYFLNGYEPSKMSQSFAGNGVVNGTLVYCNNLPELGDILSPAAKVHVSVPIWVSMDGIVAGNASGRLFNLTQNMVEFLPGNKGASLYRRINGEFQFLTSFLSGSGNDSSGVGVSDSVTVEVIRNGQVI